MTTLDRVIPPANLSVLRLVVKEPLGEVIQTIPATEKTYEIKQRKSLSREEYQQLVLTRYVEDIQTLEISFERRLIETLSRLNITAMVKTDRYSLPFKHEVVKVLRGTSYLNDAFDFNEVTREIIRDLLNNDVRKLRFYMFINVQEGADNCWFTKGFGQVEYRFRYY